MLGGTPARPVSGARERARERARARESESESECESEGEGESENLVKFRCSAAAVYERGRALYYAAVLPQCTSAAGRALLLSARLLTGIGSNKFQLLGDTGATFVGTYYCVLSTECEYQPCFFLYRILFMFAQDLICEFMRLGLKNMFVF